MAFKKVDGTLQEILGHGTVEYNEYSIDSLDTLPLIMGGGPDPLPEVHRGYCEGIERALVKLRTLKEIFEERIANAPQATAPVAAQPAKKPGGSRRVFVVHGRDDGTKETLARYLSKLDLAPIILHEQPNQGKTIIEKFEAHADVDFALVLFLRMMSATPQGSRARQDREQGRTLCSSLGFSFRRLEGTASACSTKETLKCHPTTREWFTFRWTLAALGDL